MIPNHAAGALIGKSGETIATLQKDTDTKIKLSKSNDYFPGSLTLSWLLIEFVKSFIIKVPKNVLLQ